MQESRVNNKSSSGSVYSNNSRANIFKKIFSFIRAYLIFVIPFLVVWQLITQFGLIPPYILPKLTTVFWTFLHFLFSHTPEYGSSAKWTPLLYHGAISLTRVFLGVGIAILTSVPLGIAMGLWRSVEKNLDALMSILRPIPPLAWIPLSIMWFGLGIKPVAFIIFLGAFFPILVNTIEGVKGIHKSLVEFAQVLGAKDKDILRKVVVYDALPSVITGIRVGLGVAWMTLVAAEMIATRSGLGYMVLMARWVFATDVVIVGMVSIGLIGFGMDYMTRRIERRFSRWRAAMIIG